MPVIPHSISTFEYATQGEKRLHRILSRLYGESDDEFAWYEPPALTPGGCRDHSKKRFTDFIVFSQFYGILNVEVKDWKKDRIKRIDKQGWEIEDQDGKTLTKESPIEQSRRCAYAIKDRLVKEPELCNKSGEHQGKLIFPFGFGIVFSNIRRNDLYKIPGLESLIPPDQTLCKEDLDIDDSSKDELMGFERKLKRMFTTVFGVQALGEGQLKILRRAIWPELEVTPVRTPARPDSGEDLRILDLRQEDMAKTLGEGHYLIRGVVGSGKTLVLAYRLRYLSALHPNWKMLFVCYNKSLKNYVRKMIDHLMDGQCPAGIDIFHFHELVTRKTSQSSACLPGEESRQWDTRIGVNLRQAAMNNKIVGGKYDAIMIDESQDFSTEWLSGVRELLGKSDSLTIALDPAQDIYGRRRVWKEARIDIVGGKRSKKLKQSYRNTSEILQLAIHFQGYQNYLEPDDDDPETVLAPDKIERHGERPLILKFDNVHKISERIIHEIQSFKEAGQYSYKEIALILCSPQPQLPPMLARAKIPTTYLTQSPQRDHFDIDEDSVKCITVESSKGLEWKVVFLLGVEEMPRKDREIKHEKNLIYIGITRAQERLFVFHTGETSFIDELSQSNTTT